MKKFLYFIMIFAAMIAAFTLAACGKKNNDSETTSETTDIVAEIPYINDFTCVYYDINGEKIEDKETVFKPGDEIRVKTIFTLLPEAYAEGKVKFTVKFIFSADFAGKITAVNSSVTKDLIATFATEDKNPKNCEIETRINVNFSAGSFKIAYAYDDEEYTEVCELPLNNDKTLRYTYDEATDGYIVSRNPDNYKWLGNVDKASIPDSYNDKPITIIDEELFNDCVDLKNVEIPDGVTAIGSRLFNGCSGLKTITIPDSVTSIGDGAFDDCNNLQYNEYGNAKYLGNEQNPYVVFIKPINTKITNIEINEKTKIINSDAFSRCGKLTNLTIPDSVISIGEDAFLECGSLRSVNITDIAAWCNIKFMSFYSNPMSWKSELYLNGELIQDLIIQNDVTSIGKYAFANCTGITSVTIPDSVMSIGDYAFYRCSSLTSVTIPDSVTSIGEWAFYKCSSLTGVTIPSSVTSIGGYLFQDCVKLTSVEIPESVTEIGEYAFSGCSSLTNIDIPDDVTGIGQYAFENCSSLKNITIPDGVIKIEQYSFSGCSSLTNIDIPDGVTGIGQYAFSYCSGVTSITIPDSVKGIMEAAFWGCSSLPWIEIPRNVKSIGAEAFGNCKSLKSVAIPDGVTIILSKTFSYCSSLTSVTIPNSVTHIGRRSFECCSSLTSIEIPDRVKYIDCFAFSGCSKLKKIVFDGTIDKWKSATSSWGQSGDEGNVTVKCSDGDLVFRI